MSVNLMRKYFMKILKSDKSGIRKAKKWINKRTMITNGRNVDNGS